MKKLIVGFVAVMTAAFTAVAGSTNWYGIPSEPDAYGNVSLGSVWFPTSTTISNVLLGPSAGYNLVSGTNNIYLYNQGVNLDNGQVRIGTAGQQTNCTIAGGVVNLPGTTSTNYLTSAGNFLQYSNGFNAVSTATASPGPVIVLSTYTNAYSPSNIIQTVTGECDWSGTTAGTLLISNSWPWTENAGTNQTVTFNGFAMGNSQDGTKSWYTVTNISFTVTNNGANYGPLLQNQAMFAGTSPPATPAFVAGSAGWSYGLTPGNAAAQHVIWYGTLISKY